MDWKRLDAARSDANALEVDLIEAYAQRRIGRRDFVKRGTIIGLSVPFMGAIIAACGGDDDEASDGTSGGTQPSGTTGGGGSGATGGSLVVGIQQGDSSTGLDPVNMLDLGTYNVLSQSFEFLVGVGDDGNIASTALASGWTPNDTGDVWTFDLREGVTWQDGSEFTSADVAATMDRLVEVGNAGLDGVIEVGSVDSSDPLKAVFTLVEPNGNFPVLVSMFNAQSCITPADFTNGTTLDERPAGTGAWILDSFDASTFSANFVRNPDWWGGQTPLDSTELRGFADIGTAVTAMQSGDIDVIQQFSVIGGEGLLNDDSFVLLTPPSSAHRQVWFNLAKPEFESKPLRQALAWALDREQMVDTLFSGRAELGNDHPILSSLPFYDPDAVEQRNRNVERARELMAEAGVDSVDVTLNTGDLQDIPDLAAIIQQNAAEIGINVTVNTQSNSTFYEAGWCPELYGVESSDPELLPCENAFTFGIVDYGHRPTPDIFLGSALATGGVWNSSNYSNPEFDQRLTDYRTAVDVEGQTEAIGAIQQILWDDVPAVYPYFFNYLSGHDEDVSGVQATALGHTILNAATKG
ncbi:MAG TPA: ABC transporter substrate-binding protein [Ilumatobacteraceae bacterium]|nr:ABC transporter substrate-binding protein [Ilumatobacteraceae bacterium]